MSSVPISAQRNAGSTSALALSLLVGLGASTAVSADAADAKNLIKAMSD